MTEAIESDAVRVEQCDRLTIALCGVQPPCDHDFRGFRMFDDGLGGEAVCAKCGLGAMAHTLSLDI